jgi:DNA primase
LKSNSSKASRNLIVVEGYMDVIALWNVGVKQAVASMGTALSREQLNAAAKVVQAIDGRVVLCLDNDPAGLAAVERVCGNGLLKEISEKHKVEFRVATLPENVKDPDEYVQATKATVSVGLSFIEDVAELAEDWVSWFVNRIVASYNPDAQRGRLGSFSEVFERVAEHLATAVDAADRTRAAYEVAGTLARILSRESNSTEMSEAVRSQLEADLIDTSARIANVKNSVKRRAETVALDQTDVRVSPESALKALMKGEGPSGIDEQAGNRNFVLIKEDFSSERKGNFPRKRESPELTAQRRTPMRRAKSRVLKLKSQKESEPALTPHFAGFQFANKFDEEWLLDSSPSKVCCSANVLSNCVCTPMSLTVKFFFSSFKQVARSRHRESIKSYSSL